MNVNEIAIQLKDHETNERIAVLLYKYYIDTKHMLERIQRIGELWREFHTTYGTRMERFPAFMLMQENLTMYEDERIARNIRLKNVEGSYVMIKPIQNDETGIFIEDADTMKRVTLRSDIVVTCRVQDGDIVSFNITDYLCHMDEPSYMHFYHDTDEVVADVIENVPFIAGIFVGNNLDTPMASYDALYAVIDASEPFRLPNRQMIYETRDMREEHE